MSDIETMIDLAAKQDFASANNVFNELIQQRMVDALDQEKVALASDIFNNEPEDEEQLELDLEDKDEDTDDIEDDEELTEYEFGTDEDFEEIQDVNQEGKIEAAMADYEEEEE